MKRQFCLFVKCVWSSLTILLSLIVVGSAIYRSSTQRSAYFQAFEGHVLQKHVFATYQGTTTLECATRCLRNSACLSYNYKPISNEHTGECQLNDANKVTCPECYVIEPDAIYYDDAQINDCIGRDDELSNYDLYFPHKNLTSFVNQTWSVNMNMFTICFWMQTADSDEGTSFSYAVPSAWNEITIFKGILAINDEEKDTNLGTYYDGSRHHVCATWENTAGTWNVTVDGTVINNGSGVKVGHAIPGGGYLTVGQDQDQNKDMLGDPAGFQLHQSFIGSITGMNVWSRVLPYDEILRMSKTCGMGCGDVLKWSDFLISRHGDVVVKRPSICGI